MADPQRTGYPRNPPSQGDNNGPVEDDNLGGSASASLGTEAAAEVPPENDGWLDPHVTPSGLEVAYRVKPRGYRLRQFGEGDWTEVPSVTEILNVLDAGKSSRLSWWGMVKGVEGVLKLLERGVLRADDLIDMETEVLCDAAFGQVNAEDIVKFLTEQKLTVNHVVKEATDRGLSVHDAFEQWARTGQKPFALEYPEEQRGYIDGLNLFINEVAHAYEPLEAEVTVGSAKHGFAGRFDIRMGLGASAEVVTRAYPKRENKIGALAPGDYLCDLKTSKGVYTTHHLQLAAYELASVESGYEPTDFQAIIHVTADGQYEFVVSKARPEDFLAVKAVYDTMQGLK